MDADAVRALVFVLREKFDDFIVAEVNRYGGIPALLPEDVAFREAFAEFCETILGARM